MLLLIGFIIVSKGIFFQEKLIQRISRELRVVYGDRTFKRWELKTHGRRTRTQRKQKLVRNGRSAAAFIVKGRSRA